MDSSTSPPISTRGESPGRLRSCVWAACIVRATCIASCLHRYLRWSIWDAFVSPQLHSRSFLSRCILDPFALLSQHEATLLTCTTRYSSDDPASVVIKGKSTG